jgi:glycosyltransferase involved in cell wall biosynthesis
MDETPLPRISVIIPVYNRAVMVQEALESVAKQSRPADEIILVDDGSVDGSGEAARAFENVCLVRQPNRGISAARNTGIERARGDYIAFLDSDDLWMEGKLEHQERFMNAHPEVPLCHTEEMWIRKGRRVNPKTVHRKEGGFIFLRSLERCLISPSAVMIRRELFQRVGRFDERLPVCEDYDLWLRITARYPVGFLEETLTVKRGGHLDQLSKQLKAMDLYRLVALEKILALRILPRSYRDAAFATFLEKAKIIKGGLVRRNKTDESLALDERIQRLTRAMKKGDFTQRP